MNQKAIALAGATLLFILGCLIPESHSLAKDFFNPSKSSQELISQMPETNSTDKLIAAQKEFGFKLFSQIWQTQKNQNIFVSPSSVAIALSMVKNGADGDTAQALANGLELQGMSLEDINQANQALREMLINADPQVQIAIANSLWLKQGFSFKSKFLNDNKQFYNAEVRELDFTNAQATNTINSWVKEQTKGKIDKIIDSIHPDDLLFLINAIYFKGSWQEEFNKTQTSDKPFYLPNGSTKQHPFMSQFGNYQYYKNDKFEAIRLPYGKGNLGMYIFLPSQGSNLDNFVKDLTSANWQKWVGQLRKKEGKISLPKFKLEYEIELNKALSALGMSPIFSNQADFSQMTSTPVHISTVKHKTFVEVNEAGTEAAAVTSIGVRATSLEPQTETFNMTVDRPFFFAIGDIKKGPILFMGTITEPLE